MREVSPKLAEELSTLLVLKLVLNHLKKVCPELADELAVLQISQKKSGGEKMANKKAGVSCKRFTPQEDDMIKDAIEEAGEGTHVNVNNLAKRLKRQVKSVTS